MLLLIVVGGKEYHYKTYYLSSDVNEPYNNQEILAEDYNGGNDYFVPLTANEREEMKEMLRTTLRETKKCPSQQYHCWQSEISRSLSLPFLARGW